jgi:hypothetical protein
LKSLSHSEIRTNDSIFYVWSPNLQFHLKRRLLYFTIVGHFHTHILLDANSPSLPSTTTPITNPTTLPRPSLRPPHHTSAPRSDPPSTPHADDCLHSPDWYLAPRICADPSAALAAESQRGRRSSSMGSASHISIPLPSQQSGNDLVVPRGGISGSAGC